MKFLFEELLEEGIIKSRPNRFIMHVLIDGQLEKCHCPSTGRIGDVKFNNVPCLLSKSKDVKRKTKYTVEAFSFDKLNKSNKKWVGINQTKANKYVEFFIKSNLLKNMLGKVKEVKREVKLGESRIDFLINKKDYLEVKTPLMLITTKEHKNHEENGKPFTSFDRMIKHFKDISESIKSDSRAIFLLCNLYNAEPFKVPEPKFSEKKIVNAAKRAHLKGLETWQINLKIEKNGISLIDYFKLNLF
ncbi:MAG: DNA/RNA nuclease SfsA [Candidatus Zambryskibacteria bacterium]|nr:DNA/RNA nuclease SfsA [Candidatus Zambryskibacteria bacterium]